MTSPEALGFLESIPKGKKVYFASDFHLGAPENRKSLIREKKIVRWLQHVSKDAAAIFLVGDIFDFWFEYKSTVPKGFNRFLGVLHQLKDQEIPIFIFTGNHDLWMFDYFPEEFGIPVFKKPVSALINGKMFFIGHGDGLGPGDYKLKFAKKIFINPIFQWFYKWVHPNIGVGFAKFCSDRSRSLEAESADNLDLKKEILYQFCLEKEKTETYHYYVFGHRHLPLKLMINKSSTYFNLGEWFTQTNYLEFDGKNASLKVFDY